MIPETAGVLLHAYIDGELDAASTIELESQIAASPALRQEMERLAALSHAVKTHATRFNAPSRLSKTLFAAFPDSQAEKVSSGVAGWWRTLALGTTAAAAALLLWSLGAAFFSRDARSVVIEEVVSAHVRSLMVDHLTDLASAERHSVKPWLANRLDFAPPVDEFANEGFVASRRPAGLPWRKAGGGNCLPLSAAHYQRVCPTRAGWQRRFDQAFESPWLQLCHVRIRRHGLLGGVRSQSK